MIYFFKQLPKRQEESEGWKPFRDNEWLRKHFMIFVYLLQGILIFISVKLGIWNYFNLVTALVLFAFIYIMHELLHIVVVYRKGDISLTYHGGIFLWLNPDAILSKLQYWFYMTCPILILTVIPQILALFVTGKVHEGLIFVSWVNAIIAGADILDSIFIVIKPQKSIFWRGRYKIQ